MVSDKEKTIEKLKELFDIIGEKAIQGLEGFQAPHFKIELDSRSVPKYGVQGEVVEGKGFFISVFESSLIDKGVGGALISCAREYFVEQAMKFSINEAETKQSVCAYKYRTGGFSDMDELYISEEMMASSSFRHELIGAMELVSAAKMEEASHAIVNKFRSANNHPLLETQQVDLPPR